LKEFIDKTAESNGTDINRSTMMAVQGFNGKTIQFNPDGSIVETNSDGHITITTFANNQIIETFSGEKIITKTTIFNSNNSISEVIS
jgi:hypothetical protein